MSTLRIVVCLAPSALLGLTMGATVRIALSNRPIVRTLVILALMPVAGHMGGKVTEFMVEVTEGVL